MHNVDFKAELRDAELARNLLLSVKATHVETIDQVDTYFRLASGRLKKRQSPQQATEYIFYHRPDSLQPRISSFTIYSEQQALRQFGVLNWPVWVVVRKHREIFQHTHVRIHLDRVEQLGWFIEMQSLVTPQNNLAKCHQNIHLLRQALSPALGEMISSSYAEMIELVASTEQGGHSKSA
jgi:predicted adenylyl cyclase CyaB